MKFLRGRCHLRISLIGALAAAAVVFTAIPSAAITTEHDHSSRTPIAPDVYFNCSHSPNTYATGCFAPRGDWFELLDDEPDGYSVVLQWWVMNKAHDARLRQGDIWDSEGYQAYTWQNKDLPEDRQLYFRVCRGSHATHTIHTWSCSEKGATWTS